jgi:predicted DNA-binding WGR domain protein
MPDELRSPIKHHLVLHRIDAEQGIRRFYSLMIERDLFGTLPGTQLGKDRHQGAGKGGDLRR